MSSSESTTTTTTNTVIIGSGIIGLSTAYFLSESGNADPESIYLFDASSELFRCASGFAGGFLSADWFAPSVAPLGALSYRLHAQLADEHDGHSTWGYAHSTGISLSQDNEEEAVGGSGADWLESGTSRAVLAGHNRPWEEEQMGPAWLRRTKGGTMEVISRGGSTAQIDPLRFCRWMLARVKARGVHVRYPAKVLGVLRDGEGVLSGVRVRQNGDETELPCTRLVITAGAWSPRVFSTLFPASTTQIPVSALGGHSLLLRNPHFRPEDEDGDMCHAIFATDTMGFSPEFFARTGGELYLAGLNSTTMALPEEASQVVSSEAAIGQLKACAKAMVVNVPGRELEVLREGLCFRPVTSSGRPIVSRIPDENLGGIKTRSDEQGGVYVAAGHGAWGITHAPGTGLVLAEMLQGRTPSAKIEALRLPSSR